MQHTQEVATARAAKKQRSYRLATPADTGVATVWRWLDLVGGIPYADGRYSRAQPSALHCCMSNMSKGVLASEVLLPALLIATQVYLAFSEWGGWLAAACSLAHAAPVHASAALQALQALPYPLALAMTRGNMLTLLEGVWLAALCLT